MAKAVRGKKLITPKCRVSFPSFFRPNPYNDDKKYQGTFIFDRSNPEVKAWLKEANVECKKIATEAFGEAKVLLPFRDGNEKVHKNAAYKDTILITAKSKYRPGVCAADLSELTEESDIYGGCYCRASFIPFSYDTKGNKGVAMALCNVQKLAEGEPFGGGPSNNPSEDFGASTDAAEETPFEEDDLGL